LKLLIKLSILSLFCSNVFGQKIHVLLQGVSADSSFYHIKKINNNEFWAGGEYGVLKKIDSLGNVSSIGIPNAGIDILKIERVHNYVFIITANAVIYRYDIDKKIFLKKEFPAFKNKCFYDLIALKDGTLLVCGGTSGIAKGEKKTPKGFIATIDQDLKEIKVVWKNYRKFVWSLSDNGTEGVLAVTFNGLNTRIIKTQNLNHWKNKIRIKGLIHEIVSIDNQLWYCGTKNIHYKKDGIIGQAIKGSQQKTVNKTGCLWSLNTVGEKIIAVTQNGELLKMDKTCNGIEQIKTPKNFTLYDIEKISESKILVVGHGKTACMIDFN
jgi:hypothetical protein